MGTAIILRSGHWHLMDDVDYQKLFERLDDPVRWEYPLEFDYQDAVRRFRAFTDELEKTLGIPLVAETESLIQDASFHSQILVDNAWVRFSNFGNLVAISNEDL